MAALGLRFWRAAAWSAVFVLMMCIGAASTAWGQNPYGSNTSLSDNAKSIAIIGGSTAGGAIIGHMLGGRRGALIGAAAGASTGYAIDRHRRQNEYNSQNGYYGGYYAPTNGYDSSYSQQQEIGHGYYPPQGRYDGARR